jgi:hypothetical protein
LVFDKSGNLYGTTAGGGSVFRLAVPGYWIASADEFEFADGSNLYGNVAIGANGEFFGTAYAGGSLNAKCPELGCGTVFEVTPPPSSGGPWSATVCTMAPPRGAELTVAALSLR